MDLNLATTVQVNKLETILLSLVISLENASKYLAKTCESNEAHSPPLTPLVPPEVRAGGGLPVARWRWRWGSCYKYLVHINSVRMCSIAFCLLALPGIYSNLLLGASLLDVHRD